MKKHDEYATKILGALQGLFDQDNENYIGSEEEVDVTQFIHAVATIAPNTVFQKITGQNVNNLEFNHIANKLVMQYSVMED